LTTPNDYQRLRPMGTRRALLKAGAAFGLGTVLPAGAQAGTQQIYIGADDHTDYFWTADDVAYRQAFLNTLDHYLALIPATAAEPAPYQSRWNCDGSLWLWEYERNRSPAQFQTLVAALRSGHISAPLTALVSCYGGTPTEAVIRGMYYSGRLERQYGLRFKLAVAMENQTLGLGIASLWAGAGARYSWRGICGCASRTDAADRQHEIYWMTGRDGSRVLMKWNSLLGSNTSIGGYAEARDPGAAVETLSADPAFLARWPYGLSAAFGQGWDDLQTIVPLSDSNNSFPAVARARSNASRQVIVSNQTDFFEAFESRYGAGLPSQALTYGNEWELYIASLAEVTASVRRAVEKLRAAEALAALVCLRDPSFWSGRQLARETAWINLGLYWEHDWTGDGPVPNSQRITFQRDCAAAIRSYVDTLHADGLASLTTLIPQPAGAHRVMAFNPLGHARSDVADYPYSGAWPVLVVDLAAGAEVPAQLVNVDGERRIRFIARNLPALGYKVYELRSGTPATTTACASLSGSTFESARYRLRVESRGAISSLVDKTLGSREFARSVDGRVLNDLGAGSGTLVLENAGPVSTSLRITSSAPLAHTVVITLYAEVARIDIDNRITQNFSDVRTWAFGFNLDSPSTWCEEQGALLNVKLASQGGDYATRNARYDWTSLNHFAAMSGTAAGAASSVTLSNADCNFMQLGNSTAQTLDTNTPALKVLAGGQVDGPGLGMRDQGGDSSFLQRFALATANSYDAAASMRMALGHQNPVVAARVGGASVVGNGYPEQQYSLLSAAGGPVLVWALKPAEEGIARGLVFRLWNVTNTNRSTVLGLSGGIASATRTSHIETDIGNLRLRATGLALSFKPQQMQTVRLMPAAPP
jgi:alpha-mannosidase